MPFDTLRKVQGSDHISKFGLYINWTSRPCALSPEVTKRETASCATVPLLRITGPNSGSQFRLSLFLFNFFRALEVTNDNKVC